MNYFTHPYTNPYRNQSVHSGIRQNTHILDKQIGDVNGDNIPDLIYLVGEKTENPFYEHIKVAVQDGKTMLWYVIPLDPKYSMAYTPWLILGSFTNSNRNEMMVNLPVGGSGGLTYYYVISFLDNHAEYILGPEQFMTLSDTLGFEVIYMDNYRVLVKSEKLNQSYTLDISSRKKVYEGTVYDKDGKLIKPLEGFVIDLPQLYPIKIDGSVPYKLEAQHDIAGTSHADQLGSIVLYWKYTGNNRSWVLDPEMFFVLLE
ncbi:VCBS repeat-containing protein [Bacillus sp. T3]|uniref:VCBS repeat-containing protein n=1 Tax=Bacillus sp. T3 TaxID=467262 RepID=UPI002980BBB1|nr:VCBS repeat-containing protein [Bacillus sp. T3]